MWSKIPVHLSRKKCITFIVKRFKKTASSENETKPSLEPKRIKCTLIPGEGVGPELVAAVQEVFQAASVPVDFETHTLSETSSEDNDLEAVVTSIKKNKVCLNGIFAYPAPDTFVQNHHNLNMSLRLALDLFANVVHIQTLPGLRGFHTGIDAVVIREQTEGEYSALEHESVPGIVESLKIVTKKRSEKIAKFAFDYATKHRRKKVTAVHKANIMKLGDGLFLRTCEKIAKWYPKIKFEKMIIDNCAMQMVNNPQQFDVLVTTNLYGSILNNLGAGLVGGAGVVPGALYSSNCGARHIYAVAAGKDVANPTALLLCSTKLLRHVNLFNYSEMIRVAIEKVVLDGKVLTKDMGGQSGSQDYLKAIIHNLK